MVGPVAIQANIFEYRFNWSFVIRIDDSVIGSLAKKQTTQGIFLTCSLMSHQPDRKSKMVFTALKNQRASCQKETRSTVALARGLALYLVIACKIRVTEGSLLVKFVILLCFGC